MSQAEQRNSVRMHRIERDTSRITFPMTRN